MKTCRALVFTALLTLLPAPALAREVTDAPPPAGLAFGMSPKQVARVLGNPTGTDPQRDVIWYGYALGKGQLRTSYYKERLSAFSLLPAAPVPWKLARAWALAFVPGFERGRHVRTDPARWMSFTALVINGRPFEAELNFQRHGEDVESMGGVIHWLD